MTEVSLLYDDRFSLDSPTGALLNVYHAAPKAPESGVLVVLHGLAEHAGRYARFASEMAALGLHVYAAALHRRHEIDVRGRVAEQFVEFGVAPRYRGACDAATPSCERSMARW